MKVEGETLLTQVHQQIRLRQMSKRTEEAYVRWIKEFLRFHKNLKGK